MSRYPKLPVEAVLLSHTHVDYSGNIGLHDRDIPVVASPRSVALLKGMQDSGISSVDSDVSYSSPRVPSQGGLLLNSDRRAPRRGRDFFCTTAAGEGFLELLSRRPGQEGRNAQGYEPGECQIRDAIALPLSVDTCDVGQSIFGAVGYILKGETTTTYTDDFRLHGKKGERTRDFFCRAMDASVLIMEGTRERRDTGPEGEPQDQAVSSEKTVYDACLAVIREATGVVIADFSPRNFERPETFL